MVLLLVTVSPESVSAGNYAVGVRAGEWVRYEVTGTVPSIAEYEWVKMEVLSVDEGRVTVVFTAHYRDGTEEINTLSFDIDTGTQPWVIPANLGKGDVFPFEYDSLTLNDTVTRIAAGASREVNVLSLSRYEEYTEMTAYWDRATGVLVEISLNKTSPTETWTGGYKALETNMWSPVPLRVTAQLSSNTVTQGDLVTVSATVADEEENRVEEATVTATIGDLEILVLLSDLSNGEYEGTIDTAIVKEGTYEIVVTAGKVGYESAQDHKSLTVEEPVPWVLYGGIAAIVAAAIVAVAYLMRRRF